MRVRLEYQRPLFRQGTRGVLGYGFGGRLIFERRSNLDGTTVKSSTIHVPSKLTYSSHNLVSNFDPMDSMIVSGTWKNLRFFLRSCSLRERAPTKKLICSTCHPWCCSDTPRDLRKGWPHPLQDHTLPTQCQQRSPWSRCFPCSFFWKFFGHSG